VQEMNQCKGGPSRNCARKEPVHGTSRGPTQGKNLGKGPVPWIGAQRKEGTSAVTHTFWLRHVCTSLLMSESLYLKRLIACECSTMWSFVVRRSVFAHEISVPTHWFHDSNIVPVMREKRALIHQWMRCTMSKTGGCEVGLRYAIPSSDRRIRHRLGCVARCALRDVRAREMRWHT
jgi:hypothetical protein